ncbi:type VI secretion system protein TssR domain-containing protein [Chitinophaga parva]|nr:type VI secretion system protein TssR domain-containing protein [Chitinophaga parva]
MSRFLFVVSLLLCMQARAQFSPGKRIIHSPANFRYPTADTRDPSKKTETTAWVVFSDREDNYSTTTPGGSLVFKKLPFMQPFLVSDTKEGYLRLMSYDPSVLKGVKIVDKRKAVSYGWIPRNKVLMWQKALTDDRTHFPLKALAIINAEAPIEQPKFFFSHDSIIVFNSPELQTPLKEKLKLQDLVYIYKFSEDHKKALVGHASMLTADSARQAIIGWVSADVVHLWGSRLYIGMPKGGGFAEDSIAAQLFNKHLTAVAPYGGHFETDPLLAPGNPVFRTIPVLQDYGKSLDQPFHSAVATNVFDKSGNTVINIKGSRIDYNNYLHLRRFGNRVNVVFVVDGGSSMKNYLPGITNTIQNFADVFGAKNFANCEYQFGAVVYRGPNGCYQGKGINSFEPNGTYSKVVDFINKQAAITQQCAATISDQPYYEGVQAAIEMLKKYPMQTNIVIVAGSTGNPGSNTRPPEEGLVRGLVETDARLLVFQVYNKSDPSFDNFVLESKTLLERAAQQQADAKKLRMVKGEGLATTQQFNTAYTDSVSYYLNYPDGSLIPGAIVFPGRGAVKTNREMMSALKRFLNEVYNDNRQIITSLDSVFMTSGRLKENITRPVMGAMKEHNANLPGNLGELLPHNAFKYYFDATVTPGMVGMGSPLEYALILSHDEMLQVSDLLSRLAGDNLEADRSNFRKQLFQTYLQYGRLQWKDRTSKAAIKAMKLTAYLERATGMPFRLDTLQRFTVKDIKNGMSTRDFESLVNGLRHCNQVLKVQLQTGDYFISNGLPYFYILQDEWRFNSKPEKIGVNENRVAGDVVLPARETMNSAY